MELKAWRTHTLDWADTVVRMHNDDGYIFFPSQAVDCCRPSIAARSSDHSEMFPLFVALGLIPPY